MVDAAVGDRRAEAAGQFSLFGGEEHAQTDPVARLELPREALLAAEKEMLGMYVSEHPLLSVEEALRASTDTRVSDVGALREGEARTVGGLVTRVRRKFTRKGEQMATFMLEDLDGAVEVVVFPSAFEKMGDLMVEDAVVCVKGRVDLRDDQPKIVAVEIWRPNLEEGGDPLVLSVRADAFKSDAKLGDRLREVLEGHPGLTPVHLRMASDEGAKTFRLKQRVERRNGLYAELKSLLGPGALG
jgi:DNA polymerase-3 subunit alpha